MLNKLSHFYYPYNIKKGDIINIPKNILKHIKNLRLKNNENISLFNNIKNGYYKAILFIDKNDNNLKINIIEYIKETNILKYKIIINQSIPKLFKIKLILEKLVELGVYKLNFLNCKNSFLKLNLKKFKDKYDHWKNIIINSTEQSKRNKLLILGNPISYNKWIKNKRIKKIILSPCGKDIFYWLKKNKPQNISIAIGSEGGFNKEEKKIALLNNIEIISINNKVLKIDTSIISIISILNFFWKNII